MQNTPLIEKNMFNTLAFSKKMQNVGMTQAVSEELASTLLNMHVNQFENLLTKNEFCKFDCTCVTTLVGLNITDIPSLKY